LRKRSLWLGSLVLSGLLIMLTTLAVTRQQSHSRNTQSEDIIAMATAAPDSSPKLQGITYKIAASTVVRAKYNKRIIWISIEPEDFTRDKMLLLARLINNDFPDEPRIYAVIFDSEITARNYNPAGGSYYVSKKLERGEYYLDRIKGRGQINFSSQRGNSVGEIKITLSNGSTPVMKVRRVTPTHGSKRTF
jgi:hypothetical protein